MEQVNQLNLEDVVIVSAFGRGNWLAMELKQKGWKVTLVDVSEKLGPWSPEDVEGPFGFLESTEITESQKERLLKVGESFLVEPGMTFWLPGGPLECRSDLTDFQLQKWQKTQGLSIAKEVQEYLRTSPQFVREQTKMRQQINKLSFDDTWLAGLAHQLADSAYAENHVALGQGQALPVFAPLWVRRITEKSRQQDLEACEEAGVRVRSRANVLDVRTGQRHMDAIEIEDNAAGVEKARAFVWMLSAAETEKTHPRVAQKLFPKGAVEPEWYWTRYRVALKGRVYSEQLPAQIVVVDDMHLPWTHANLLVLRQSAEPGQIDVWARLPLWARFDTEYQKELGREIEKRIDQRLPQGRPEIVELPIDTRVSREELGPPRWPVQGSAATVASTIHLTNLFFDGPELWGQLDVLGACRHQSLILSRLDKLKAAWDAEERKRALKAAKREQAPSETGERDLNP